MGQRWVVVCIDKEERVVFEGWIRTLFNDGLTIERIEALIRPFRALPQIPRIPNGADALNIQTSGRTAGSGSLAKLPLELLYHIVADIAESIIDLLNFASVCHLFWDISRPLIEQHFKTRTWAGSRIICIGNYVDNLPPGVLSDAEKTSMEEKYAYESYNFDEDAESPPSLYEIALEIFKRPVSTKRLLRDIMEDLMWDLMWDDRPPGAVRAAFACMPPVDYETAGKPAVLRNLSKKSFVCSQAVDALSKTLLSDPNSKGFGLAHAMMTRICWSSDPSYSVDSPEGFTRGSWAGDRFDAILVEEFETQGDHAEWKDVGEEVCSELGQCWKTWWGSWLGRDFQAELGSGTDSETGSGAET